MAKIFGYISRSEPLIGSLHFLLNQSTTFRKIVTEASESFATEKRIVTVDYGVLLANKTIGFHLLAKEDYQTIANMILVESAHKFNDVFRFDRWGEASNAFANFQLDLEFVHQGKRTTYRKELNNFALILRRPTLYN